MSGFIRPSIVGPCELYDSSDWFSQQMAPAAMTFGDDAGSTMLPPSVENCSAPTSP
jgi:hypothetical protein